MSGGHLSVFRFHFWNLSKKPQLHNKLRRGHVDNFLIPFPNGNTSSIFIPPDAVSAEQFPLPKLEVEENQPGYSSIYLHLSSIHLSIYLYIHICIYVYLYIYP